MRGMNAGLRLIGLAALLIGAVACNEKTGADKFAGTWIYAGMVTADCLTTGIDLTGETTTITATDGSHIVVDLEGFCTISMEVDGFTATAGGGQTCTLPVPGLGAVPVSITSWTLVMSGGDVIDSDFTGTGFGCVAMGSGTLTRQGGDGGTTD
jgi:hypothetical protein